MQSFKLGSGSRAVGRLGEELVQKQPAGAWSKGWAMLGLLCQQRGLMGQGQTEPCNHGLYLAPFRQLIFLPTVDLPWAGWP